MQHIHWYGILVLACQINISHAAPSTTLPIDRVISVVTTDWNEDGLPDRAILMMGDDTDADLYIFQSENHDPQQPKTLKVYQNSIAWMGNMWGTWPSLELNARNSLLIHSGNEAIGRNRWQQTLTVAYREQQFKVVGYTYRDRDTLDLETYSHCEINYLNGKAVINGKTLSHREPAKALSQWKDKMPKLCQTD
ncbi:MAG: hypothetical protein VXW65_14720 [Pseudomonadota bacterium]|nr:hypothetical protein [Pseudomonadota bacterium]